MLIISCNKTNFVDEDFMNKINIPSESHLGEYDVCSIGTALTPSTGEANKGVIKYERNLKVLSKDYPYIFFVIKADKLMVTSSIYYNGKTSGNIIEDYYSDELFKNEVISYLMNTFDEDKAEQNFINGNFFELVPEKVLNDEIIDFMYRKISILGFNEILFTINT